MSIETVKLSADLQAEKHAEFINVRAPVVGVQTLVKPNYKFFRRLAGLSGNDLRKDKDPA